MASKRDRLRAAQLAQLEAPAALAEVEKAPPKRKKRSQKAVPPRREPAASKGGGSKKGHSGAMAGGRRLAFRAAQQAQLEALPVLGEADKALLGPFRWRKARKREPDRLRALRRKAGFQALLLAQLDASPVLAQVERELLSLPKERGPLFALTTALARLRVQLTGDGRRARRRETEPEAIKKAPVVEEAAPEIAEAVAPGSAMPGLVSGTFNKVATLTAALEEMGVAREDFGFTVTFGSLVTEEDRDSVFSVSGIGLSELSHHLSRWFEEAGRSDFPLQVIDEGSGKLKIFISET